MDSSLSYKKNQLIMYNVISKKATGHIIRLLLIDNRHRGRLTFQKVYLDKLKMLSFEIKLFFK